MKFFYGVMIAVHELETKGKVIIVEPSDEYCKAFLIQTIEIFMKRNKEYRIKISLEENL